MSATIESRDEQYVYGACCMWHGPISEVGHCGPGDMRLPCCPKCSGMLFQTTKAEWDSGALTFENNGHPNYREFLSWVREQPKCFSGNQDAAREFFAQTGKHIDFKEEPK